MLEGNKQWKKKARHSKGEPGIYGLEGWSQF